MKRRRQARGRGSRDSGGTLGRRHVRGVDRERKWGGGGCGGLVQWQVKGNSSGRGVGSVGLRGSGCVRGGGV